MQLSRFDLPDIEPVITQSSPAGWSETGIADACFPDGPSEGAYFSFLVSYFESIGFTRDITLDIRELRQVEGLEPSDFRIFRRVTNKAPKALFIVRKGHENSGPDIAVTYHITPGCGFLRRQFVKRGTKTSRRQIPSGWMQPFVSFAERAERFDGLDDFETLCTVARILQSHLYSGGDGVLPRDLQPLFDYYDLSADPSLYEFLETGETSNIWFDRPVLRYSRPIDGVFFGCNASADILPLGTVS